MGELLAGCVGNLYIVILRFVAFMRIRRYTFKILQKLVKGELKSLFSTSINSFSATL